MDGISEWYRDLLDAAWTGRAYVPIANRGTIQSDLELIRRYGISFSTDHEGRVTVYAKAHACSDVSHSEQRCFATFCYRIDFNGLAYPDFPSAIREACAIIRKFQEIQKKEQEAIDEEDRKELVSKA